MIKVCHLTSAHNSNDTRIFIKECVSLVKSGYDVYLVARGDSREDKGVHVIGVGEAPDSRLKRMTSFAKKVYETALSLDCDIYHFHDPELLPYGLKLKKQGKKVIFDSHELTREQIKRKQYLPKFARIVISRLYTLYENSVLNRIDGVIFPCPVNGRFPLPGRRTVYLNNYPRLGEMYDKYDPSAQKIPRSVCTVGSLTYDRGIKHLVLAGAKAQCRIFLGGLLSPDTFEKEIKSMPESENVEFMGFLNRELVREVYNQSLICASAILNVGQYSAVENMSTKVYECMAMGLPVVLTRQPFNEKMIEKYDFGLCVDPKNIEEYSDAIMFLLDNPEKAHEMGLNGRKVIKEYFNWEKEEINLINLYRAILENITI